MQPVRVSSRLFLPPCGVLPCSAGCYVFSDSESFASVAGRTAHFPQIPTRGVGYSVGKWDGDTLVIERCGFDDRAWLDQDGNVYSREMNVQEVGAGRIGDARKWDTVSRIRTLLRVMGKHRGRLSNGRLVERFETNFWPPSKKKALTDRVRDPAGGRTRSNSK